MKNNKQALLAALVVVLAANPAFAAGGMDFSAITGAIDATTIVAAITAIAAIKILPGVAKWGFGKVISWFK